MAEGGNGAHRHLELEIASDPAKIAEARRAIEAFALSCGFDKAAGDEIGLVLNEALANIIRHAYHGAIDRPIRLSAGARNGELRLTLRDWGDGVNPISLPLTPRDPAKPGGLGLICLMRLMDEVVFTPQSDGMTLTMTRKNKSAKGGLDGMPQKAPPPEVAS